ncbi:RNA ligase [Lentzea cavernae]|uniref:T4 RNA ligase 1-like N-terminal domain-containing protein n=1 Tax=Lentzea cavernae TaxID=2020703 RepID=A0ABQ3MQX0_9PSEU|nr:RNA ligase [Lentzea cavernae]GHH57467.1 hypothetical protein GCM10017774_77000 [Lentzea cavernae]
MSTRLDDLFDILDLETAIDAGYVRAQQHPHLPLTIFNYTEKAAYERAWTPVTRQCRGLIADSNTSEIVARPFPKFFNHNETEAAALDFNEPVVVTDKADGSLGILYPTPTGWAIATRGSFVSDQAQHATALYRGKYGSWTPPPGVTVLFEIVYPENRIVLDYGATDDLILLGLVDIKTGQTLSAGAHFLGIDWPGPIVESFPHGSLAEALAAEPRANAEGLVVHLLTSDQRVKIKQADYVAMHRIVTGFTARRLWERNAVHATLAAHPDMPIKRVAQQLRLDPVEAHGIVDAGTDWLDALRAKAPEEFLAWIDATIRDQQHVAANLIAEVGATAEQLALLPRKDAAALLVDHPHRGLVFAALDGKPITAQAWASIYPAHERPFWTRTEDAA